MARLAQIHTGSRPYWNRLKRSLVHWELINRNRRAAVNRYCTLATPYLSLAEPRSTTSGRRMEMSRWPRGSDGDFRRSEIGRAVDGAGLQCCGAAIVICMRRGCRGVVRDHRHILVQVIEKPRHARVGGGIHYQRDFTQEEVRADRVAVRFLPTQGPPWSSRQW